MAELEARIARLDARRAELASEVDAAGADYVRLEALSAELTRIGAQIDATLPRWLELAELAGAHEEAGTVKPSRTS
jgi:ATP-binding cassette subfamily F protein uup